MPGVEIHYITKKAFQGIIENNPYISKAHYIEKGSGTFTLKGVSKNKKNSPNSFNRVIKDLKKEDFDLIIDLHNNLRSMQIKIALRKPSFTFKKLNTKKWLLVNLKINKMPSIHIVERYLKTVESIGITNDRKGLDYFIPQKDEVNIDSLPLSHRNGYIGFVIGAKHFTKQLPTEKIISICKKINLPIILLGGKEDFDRGNLIKENIDNAQYASFLMDSIENNGDGSNKNSISTIYNACGKFNLNQSASLIKQAYNIITHDTGLMHIASAFNKKIISVWGNTVPAFGFAPYLPHPKSKIIEVQNLSCRPCSKIGYGKCPKTHFKCMTLIDEKNFI